MKATTQKDTKKTQRMKYNSPILLEYSIKSPYGMHLFMRPIRAFLIVL